MRKPSIVSIYVAPETSKAILSLVLSTVRGELKEAIEVYGNNEVEWGNVLFTLISKDQLRPQFGGTKIDSN